MTDVEQKVVQMRFDDKDFDEKAKKTMKTLDKLADKLSFDEVAKRSDAAFKEVTENVEKIADQAYTIVDRVIDKIRNDIADKLVGYIKSATIDQVANGWQKYADMTSAVGTLLSQGHKIEKVNKTLEDLSYFADETSYSFNDMLSGISSFTAAGVGLDDAKVALMGISNWAAQSGKNAQTASALFLQLSQAMGTYMKRADWRSVETANMDTQEFKQTALDTAVALGTLKEVSDGVYKSLKATTKKGAESFTINSFAESLTQGAWLTRDVMVETYKKYAIAVDKIKEIYDETGGEVKTGTIIKERQKINKELIDEYKEMYKVTDETAQKELDKWSSVSKATKEEVKNYATLNKISEAVADKKINAAYYNAVEEYSKRTRKSMQETEKDMEHWSEYISEFSLKAFLNAQEARTFADVISSVKESAASAWREIYTAIFGDYNEAKVLWTDLAEGLIEIFTDRLYAIADIFSAWKEAGGRTTMLQGMYAFGGGIKMFIDEIRAAWDDLITDGEEGVNVLLRISEKIREAGFKFYLFMEALRDNGVFKNIAEALHNIKSFIDQVFGALYDGIRDAIPGGNFFLTLLIDFTTLLKDLTANFKLSDTALEGLRKTFKGVFIILNHSKKTIMDLLIKVVLPILNVVFSVLGNIMDVVLTLTGTIGDIIEYFIPLDGETSGWIKALSALADILGEVIKLIGNGLSWALQKIIPIFGVILGSVVSLGKAIGDLFNTKKIKMGGGSNLIKGFDGLKDKILEAWAPLKSFTEIIDQYKNGKGLTNFLNLFTDITDGIGNRLLLTMDATVGFIETLGESKFGKALKGAISVLRWVIRAGLWLFNNLLVPALKEIVRELGLTVESIKGIIEQDGILGLLHLIQEVFKTGIFGEIVNTINLINSVIGGNGIGKLMSKGAKALESITSYFNAAKMNQAADVMLKIVAALGLLYTLLALITFVPIDRYEEMKKALLDFGIALGIVVGGVFVISAAAALAGGNLIAMAAGFIGVALAIATALWALKKMVAFIDEVNVDIIDKGTEKLMEILDTYSWFLLKTLSPLVLISAKWNGDIGGVGFAMAGMAASIWLLMKTLKEVGTIDPAQIQNLFDALSGIYVVIAASTSLMILAAAGKDVHGISIAIASVGVAFAAIKMVLPLCKDVIAEKDVFIEGQSALATFGLFMLAFAASMYLVTSGVHGIITSMVSLLLFKAFANFILNDILPAVLDLIKGVMDFSKGFADYYKDMDTGSKIFALGTFITTLLAALGTLFALTGMFRMLFDTWADIDTVSMVAISVAVVGSLLIFSELLIPAVQKLSATVQNLSTGDFWSLAILLGLMVAPVISIMHALNRIIYNYSQMYGTLKNARFAVNIGIVNRQYSEIASMMSSISIMIVGLYGLMTAFLYLASKISFTEGQLSAVKTVLRWTFFIVLAILIPMCIMFRDIIDSMNMNITAGKLYNINKSVGPAGLFSKVEDTATAIVKAVSGTISIVAVFVTAIPLVMGFLAKAISEQNKVDDFIRAMDALSSITIGLMIGMAILAGILAYMAKSNPLEANATTASNTKYFALAATMNAMKWIVIGILGTVVAVGGIAMIIANTLNKEQYSRFRDALFIMSLLVLGMMAAFIGFIHLLTKPLRSMVNIADPSSQFRILLVIAASIFTMVVALSVIAFQLLPVIQKFQNMDTDKMAIAFGGVFALMAGFLLGAIGIMTVGSKMATASTAQGVVAVIEMIAAVLAPLLGLTALISGISKLVEAANGMSSAEIMSLGLIILAMGMIAAIIEAIGLAIGYSGAASAGTVIAGVAVVALLMAAIGAMALMIAVAAEKIYAIYKDWTGITTVIGKIGEIRSKGMADGQIKGIEDNTDAIIKAQTDQNEAIEKADAKFWGRKSPDKKTQGWGKWLDLGLAKGITDHTKEVKRAIDGTAKVTSSVFEEDLEINSPSKVFYKNGRFIVAGLQEGITSKKTSLADTMSDLGDTLANSISSGFENVDIDIFGGKTLEDFIHEFTGGEDAGSIIGKMFGLDQPSEADAALIEKYQNELAELNKANPNGPSNPFTAQRMDWLKAQIDALSNKSLGTKVGDKISGLLKSDTVKNLVSDGAKALGIEITDSMTSDEVLDSLGKKILGEEGDRTFVGEMFDKVSSGDWSGLGRDIAGGIINGMKSALGTDLAPVIRMFKRINPFDSASLDDYFSIKNLEDGLSIWESDSDTFASFKDHVGKAMFKFDKSFNDYTADQVMNAINIDYANRMKEFASALDNAKVWDEYTKTWIYHIDESCEAAIKELFAKWGIASPSKVSTYAYQMVGEGGVNGIKEYTPKLVKAMQDQTSEEYKTMSLGVQALDELASGETVVQPRLVPIIDTASMAAFTGITDAVSGVNGAKISASLDYSGSMSFLAAGQAAIVSAVDAMKRDLLNSLSLGELIKVDVNSTVNDDNLFDHFVSIDRQEYNRTGRHTW